MNYCPHFKDEEGEALRRKFICPNQVVSGRADRSVFTMLPPHDGSSRLIGTNGYTVSDRRRSGSLGSAQSNLSASALWVTGPPHSLGVVPGSEQLPTRPRVSAWRRSYLPAHFSSALTCCCSCSCLSRLYLNCSCCIFRHVALSRSSPAKHCKLAGPQGGSLWPRWAGNSIQRRPGSQRSNSRLFLSCCFCSRNSWTFLASRRVRSACSFSSIWATRSYCSW